MTESPVIGPISQVGTLAFLPPIVTVPFFVPQ